MDAEAPAHAEIVVAERSRLFGLAYRMLGSVTEAEDAVQEAFARLTRATDPIDEPAAWLTTVLTRICIDELRKARREREEYVGEWLPEPLATEPGPEERAAMADSLTLAFLVVLESLSPLERAAFLLHDVFGYDFGAVARTLDRSPAAARQLASRARTHVGEHAPRHEADREQAEAVTRAFLAACAGEDLDQLLEVLSPDVVFIGDGGGRATAVPAPVHGAVRVAKMLMAFTQVGLRRQVSVDMVEVNHQPAIWVREGDRTVSVMVFEVTDGRITAIRGVVNPEKLRAFGAN